MLSYVCRVASLHGVPVYTGPAHSQGQCTLVHCQTSHSANKGKHRGKHTANTEPVLPAVLCVNCGRAAMEIIVSRCHFEFDEMLSYLYNAR